MSRDDGEIKEGISRRGFVKGALAMGVVGAAVAGGALALRSLVDNVPPDAQETFLYVGAFVTPKPWWVARGLVGEEARFSHFKVGSGANVLWRWYLDDDRTVVGGVSALLMRVDEGKVEFPSGYAREEFVVEGLYAVFNCCTHACCRPGWQLIPRSSYKNDLGLETLYCPCHDAQYHPTRIVLDTHPEPPYGSGAQYIGVARLAGPANRGMPLIPIEVREDVVLGKLREVDWYRYLDTMDRPFL